MKKPFMFLLALLSLPLHAQSILGSLDTYQNTLTPTAGTDKTATNPISTTTTTTAITGGRCEENDQTSLPLKYVTSLLLEKNANLLVVADARSGLVSVSSKNMISNCSDMLEWKMRTSTIEGKKVYAIEVKIRETADCTIADGCKYKVSKVEKGSLQDQEVRTFKPTLKGFEACLEKSGVVTAGKVNADAIYSAPLQVKLPGATETGSIMFVSHGPATAMVKPKFGDNFEAIDKCDSYEKIAPQGKNILSFADEESIRLDKEVQNDLKICTADNYFKMDWDKLEAHASSASDIRVKLIKQMAGTSATAILEGKYKDTDLEIMSEFEDAIIEPLVEKARSLYAESLELEGDAKRAKLEEIKKFETDVLAPLYKSPYFTAAHTRKLQDDGRFDKAEQLNGMILTLLVHSKLGTKENNVEVTPKVALAQIMAGRKEYSVALVKTKSDYEIKTGQVTGQAAHYNALASAMRASMQERTQNYTAEIQSEYQRMQQGGFCYAYFRNTQRCLQDSAERIQELQGLLTQYNKIDAERAVEYDNKAKEFGTLEAEGRRYIATQNGEPVPTESTTPTSTTQVPTRAQDPSTYSFNFQQGQGQGQQQMPQQQMPQQGQQWQQPQQWQQQQTMYPNYQQNMFQQQQYSPPQYQGQMQGQFQGQYQQQQPYMGQQNYSQFQGGNNYGWGGGGQQYSFQYNGGQQQMGYQQPQQQGYGNQPMSAYNFYSMYSGQR